MASTRLALGVALPKDAVAVTARVSFRDVDGNVAVFAESTHELSTELD